MEGTELASRSRESPSVTLGARVSLLGDPTDGFWVQRQAPPGGAANELPLPLLGARTRGGGWNHTPKEEAPLHVGTCLVAGNPASAQPCSEEGREGG